MLVKFESKSNRVKGLSFHPKRPWLLASLHNGVIQLLDYQMCTLLDRFEEHDGPVRGVDFHVSQPLFVSGGDDHKVKVWDYKLRRCLFTLSGHLDYIRTVQFHQENPWILSASDDQTIRIWNWMSRSCVTVLTGHNHYVMCAQFHPKDDLVVSASLDQTVRVWDTSGLRKKTVRSSGPPVRRDDDPMARVNADLFGGADAVVKYVLEGHDRGVNWASFHPSVPLIVSGADDRQVKLWRMNETKAWEVDTLRGHTNNVSCVLFHPRQELVLSDSEDRSIRVWDVSKQMGVQTFRREHDRFWVLSAHPTHDLLAAGHDSGCIVFKLERERPAYGCVNGLVYYVKDRYLRRCVLGSGSDVPVQGLQRRERHARSFGTKPRTLCINPFNPAEDQLLVFSTVEGGSYELFCLNAAGEEPRRGSGVKAAVFLSKSRFATLDTKAGVIQLKNMQNETTKRLPVPHAGVDMLFQAHTSGRVLVRYEDKLGLFETQSRRVTAEVHAPRVKYVIWSSDGSRVALVSKQQIVIANKALEPICTITEAVRIKSGVWDENGVFVFTTHNHIKYVLPLPSAECGIIRTLDLPVYALWARGTTLHALDRAGKVLNLTIDPTEYIFKLAVNKGEHRTALRMVRSGRLCGQAVIAYLQKAGFPEVALEFVQDQQTRFNLALECGALEVALEAANELNTDDCWHRLGTEALRQGNHQVVERAYQQTHNFERLSFLYLITGNTEKLRKMLKIAKLREDVMARFHNALFLGDVGERVELLESVGQIGLAYVAARTHGLMEDAERLAAALEAHELPIPDVVDADRAKYLMPPTPLMREGNWPLLNIPGSGAFADIADGGDLGVSDPEEDGEDGADGGGWDIDLELDGDGTGGAAVAVEADATGGDGDAGWDVDLDGLDLGPDEDEIEAGASGSGGAGAVARAAGFRPPEGGTSQAALWVKNSSVAADHVAAGSFESAMNLLHRQIGFVRFEPLREVFMQVYEGAQSSLPTLPSLPSLATGLTRNPTDSAPPGERTLPDVCITLSSLVDRLKSVYKAFQGGHFGDAANHIDFLLRAIPLVVVESRDNVNAVKELLGITSEYKVAVMLELERREVSKGGKDSLPRQLELAAYMTHCNLQPAHLILAFDLAMTIAFKAQNFIHAAWFASRMLELPETGSSKNAARLTKAKKVLRASEAKARNAITIDYDERNPFRICVGSLTPIYKGKSMVACPYTNVAYKPEFKDTVCRACGMAQVGQETLGLVCSVSKSRR